MKLTNNRIRQIIKEELDSVLNEEEKEKTYYEKIITLMSKDIENLGVALSLYDALKDDPGAFQEVEKEHFQRLIPYASASYRHRSLVDEMASIRKKLGVAARKDENWSTLKKERSANLRAMRELEHNINPRDKRMIAQVTGFA